MQADSERIEGANKKLLLYQRPNGQKPRTPSIYSA